MKLYNKIILLIVSAAIIIGIFIFIDKIEKEPQETYNNLPLYTSSAMWVYDTSTPEKAITNLEECQNLFKSLNYDHLGFTLGALNFN